ncbi:MAG: MFS transporter, partial [Alphaproteobacteria bacterium]
DRIGHRRVVLGSLAVMGAASFAGSFATGGVGLLICRFLEGVGFLGVVIAAPSLIAGEVRAGDRAVGFGIWGSYHPAGGTLVLVMAPLVMALWGWRGLWQVTGLLSLAFIILVVRARPRPPDHGAHPRAGLLANVARTVGSRGPWLPALSFGFYTMQFTALMGWLPTYLVENRGVSTGTAGLLTALVIAVNVPGAVLGGVLLRRGFGHGVLVGLTSMVMAVMAVLIFSPAMPDGVRYAACVGLSFFGGIIPASLLAAAPLVAPSSRQLGTTNGLIVQGSNIGNVLGPPLLAAVTTMRGRWEDSLWMFLVFAVLNIGLSFALRREEARRKGTSLPGR